MRFSKIRWWVSFKNKQGLWIPGGSDWWLTASFCYALFTLRMSEQKWRLKSLKPTDTHRWFNTHADTLCGNHRVLTTISIIHCYLTKENVTVLGLKFWKQVFEITIINVKKHHCMWLQAYVTATLNVKNDSDYIVPS